MNYRRTNAIFASILSDQKASISLQHFDKIEAGVYSASFTADREGYSPAELRTAFSRLTAGAFDIADETLYRVPNKHYHIYRGVAVANTKSIEYNDDNIKNNGLKLQTANVFIDGDEQIWKLVGDGDGKRLVLTSTDNYDELLAAKKSRQLITASFEDHAFRFGDFVAFYNAKVGRVDSGYALNNHAVLSMATGDLLEVNAASVTDVADGQALNNDTQHLRITGNQHIQVAMDADGKRAYLSFWRELYGEKSDYYKKLEKLVKHHAL